MLLEIELFQKKKYDKKKAKKRNYQIKSKLH